MSLVLSDQDQVTLTAVALEADGTTPDPNAKITWEIDNPAFATLTDNGNGTALVAGVSGSDGNANITATATDPDGNVVSSTPFAITTVSGATDAKTVSVTAGTPTPKA